MRQKRVLLSFVKTVDLIHKQNGALAQVPVLPSMFNNLFNIFFATGDSRDFNKIRLELVSNYARQSCLAGAWRAPKYQVDRLSFFNHAIQNLAITD